MSTNNPERDRTEALPAPEHTEALPSAERTDRTEAPPATTAPAPTGAPAATGAPAPTGTGSGTSTAPSTGEAWQAPTTTVTPEREPEQLRGPYLAPVILGLVCLAVAGLVFAQEVGDWTIDWGNVGPLSIVAAGALLVILGAVGLATSRRRR